MYIHKNIYELLLCYGHGPRVQIRQFAGCPPAKAFRLKGPEVEISRRGDEIVLREKPPKKRGLAEAFDILASMPADAFEGIKDERPPEEREGL